MYGKFTDRAKKVMMLANQEAQRLNHEYIDTEHVLIGLLNDKECAASIIIKGYVDLEKVKKYIEELMRPGPDMVVMGRLPMTPKTKKVITNYSLEESIGLGHSYVGTEHLLLGLLKEEESIAAQVLNNFGIKLKNVRRDITSLIIGDDDINLVVGDDMKEQTHSKEPLTSEDYLKIPKKTFNLYYLLRAYGFDVRDSLAEQFEKGVISEIYGGIEEDKKLGVIKTEDRLTIIYTTGPEQLEGALYLREILDRNLQSYSEEPSREEIVAELRRPFQKTIDLADRLEGKVK